MHLVTYFLTPYLLPLTSYLLPLTSYLLPLTSYLLPLTSYPLPLTSYLLPLTSYLLPLTSYPLPLLSVKHISEVGKEVTGCSCIWFYIVRFTEFFDSCFFVLVEVFGDIHPDIDQ